MPFLSIEFAVFFLLFFPLYWLFGASPRVQNWLLLLASMGWLYYLNPLFAAAVAGAGLLNVVVAQQIVHSIDARHAKTWLIIGISLAVLNLAVFKYYDFFRAQLPHDRQSAWPDLLLPLGISYYTFQSIAYLSALYRYKPVKLAWHELLLHLSFFATITSGPIFRAERMKTIDGEHEGAAAQIQNPNPRQIIRPALAITLILLGIIKKWCFAGTIGDGWVDPVFNNPLQYDTFTLLTAIYGYTAQLFFDFSGYTDLAIGLAMLLGFQLPPNFRMPLIAHNIRDFWNRWHISLSTWIRDYIYIPLGGNRKGFLRTQIHLLLAMLLSGIWHGHSWNFALWGLLHGLALVLLNCGDRLCGKRDALAAREWTRYIGIFFTLNFVCFTFVIFRAQDLSQAALIFQALIDNLQFSLPAFSTALLFAAMLAALIAYQEILRGINRFVRLLERLPVWLWALPISAVFFLIMIFAPSGIPGFIYANF